jgi:hypothetical protein
MLEAARALSPIAMRIPLIVSMAVHRLCNSAKIRLALVNTRIPFEFSNRPPGPARDLGAPGQNQGKAHSVPEPIEFPLRLGIENGQACGREIHRYRIRFSVTFPSGVYS